MYICVTFLNFYIPTIYDIETLLSNSSVFSCLTTSMLISNDFLHKDF